MSNLINYVKSFANQEEGQDLLEYALLVALIALIAIGAVGMAGGAVNTDLHQHRERADQRGVVHTEPLASSLPRRLTPGRSWERSSIGASGSEVSTRAKQRDFEELSCRHQLPPC